MSRPLSSQPSTSCSVYTQALVTSLVDLLVEVVARFDGFTGRMYMYVDA